MQRGRWHSVQAWNPGPFDKLRAKGQGSVSSAGLGLIYLWHRPFMD